MSLNVQEIKGFRAADKSYKKYDSRGLLLLVKPNGSKLWYFKYRFGGKEKKLPIGAFPEISLSQARQLRDRARLKVSDGIDPMLERKRKKARIKLGAENTFEVIANKYIDEKMVPEGRAEAYGDGCAPREGAELAGHEKGQGRPGRRSGHQYQRAQDVVVRRLR